MLEARRHKFVPQTFIDAVVCVWTCVPTQPTAVHATKDAIRAWFAAWVAVQPRARKGPRSAAPLALMSIQIPATAAGAMTAATQANLVHRAYAWSIAHLGQRGPAMADLKAPRVWA